MNTAAELIRKGGTLVSESCSICAGVQVKFSGKLICVNCGNEEETEFTENGKKQAKTSNKQIETDEVVIELKKIVLLKISELLPALKSEKDHNKQADLTELIRNYLVVLEKISNEYKSS